jgi:hypothetical protein
LELAAPASGWHDLQQLVDRARAGAEAVNAEGGAVRFLRSVYVPEDERCFFLYESESAQTVDEAGRRAELRIVAIDEALRAEISSEGDST